MPMKLSKRDVSKRLASYVCTNVGFSNFGLSIICEDVKYSKGSATAVDSDDLHVATRCHRYV